MTECPATTSASSVAFDVSSVPAAMEFGSSLKELGYHSLSIKSDNSTDGVTCESLLDDLHAAQAKGSVILRSTEKMLIVILERIVGDEHEAS